MTKKELAGLTADHLFWDPHFHERLEKDLKELEVVSKDLAGVNLTDCVENPIPPDLTEAKMLLTLDSLGTNTPPRDK